MPRKIASPGVSKAATPPESISQIGLAIRYVRIRVFSELTGYTEKAIRRKIEDGVWIEGREYRRAPDGRVLIDMERYSAWVES